MSTPVQATTRPCLSASSVPLAPRLCEDLEFHEESQGSLEVAEGGVALMVDREQRLQAKPLDFHQNTHHFIPPHPTIQHNTPLHPAPPAHSISPQLTPLISMAVKV